MSAPHDTPRGTTPGRTRWRVSSRDSAFLALSSGINGLLAYVFFMLASRSLGAEAAAPVSVLWSYWAAAAAVVTFPVQHWTIRRFTRDGHEGAVAGSLLALSAVVAGFAFVAGVVAFVLREQLFDGDGLAFPAMVVAVTLGSFFMGVVRGVLSGRRRYRATGASLVAEGAVRALAAGAVTLAGGGAVAFGVALVVGPLSGLAWAPDLRLGSAPPGATVPRNPLAPLSGIAGGSLVAQLVLTGAPVLLAVHGGASAQVTALFLALAVWRAPYLVAMGVTPQLTTALTRLALAGPRRVLRTARATVGLVLGTALVSAALGATVVQPLLRLIFGSDISLGRLTLAVLGVGTAFALGNLVLLLTLLALGRSKVSTGAWVAALLVAGAWLALSPLPSLSTIVGAFVVAEGVALVLLFVAVERSARHGAVAAAHEPPAVL